jgi:hypothetical protein
MRQIPKILIVLLAVCPYFGAQTSPENGNSKRIDLDLRGRIVLYHWVAHELTMADRFVVKTEDKKHPYVRVIYMPFWGFDAPTATERDRLDRQAFVAHGSMWTFFVHSPDDGQQEIDCQDVDTTERYRDETGEGEIPLFVPTPGTDISEIPAIATLPCYILKRGGLKRVEDAKTMK